MIPAISLTMAGLALALMACGRWDPRSDRVLAGIALAMALMLMLVLLGALSLARLI